MHFYNFQPYGVLFTYLWGFIYIDPELYTRNIWTNNPYMDILLELHGPYGQYMDFSLEYMDSTVHI